MEVFEKFLFRKNVIEKSLFKLRRFGTNWNYSVKPDLFPPFIEVFSTVNLTIETLLVSFPHRIETFRNKLVQRTL